MAPVAANRKRKASPETQPERPRKLPMGEKVEVLQYGNGLDVSWITGTVIGVAKFYRLIEYCHLITDDGMSKVVETVPVSPAVEDMAWKPSRPYRGLIRPLPPTLNIKPTHLTYGVCVDAYVDDAWQEGVVFDRNEGCAMRWKIRGKWLFLQVLTALNEEGPLPVSIQNIWYDLMGSAPFREQIGWWMSTSASQTIWYNLTSKLITELNLVASGQLPICPAVPKK